MSDLLPSSCPKNTISKLSSVLLLLAIFPCFSFKAITRETADRSEDMEMMHFRTGVAGWAQNYTGIHYRHGGRGPSTGFDCSGFTSYILEEFQVKVSACSRTQSAQGDKVGLNDVLPGDLVFFGNRGRIQHVAMVVERTKEGIFCVHSTSSRGVVVENVSTSKYWKPKILFARDVISGQVAL
jgi:cell wall-associated NlpC family hydrolase